MSISQLFFKENANIGGIEIDAIMSESATSKATATKNPVEKGADTTDHIRIEPMSFTASGVVSDTPVRLVGNLVNIFKNSGHRISVEAWNKLLKLQTKRQPFTLQQGLRSYDNIAITELNYTQDASTANVLMFNAKMDEIILVGQTETDASKITDKSTSSRFSTLINLGRKALKL